MIFKKNKNNNLVIILLIPFALLLFSLLFSAIQNDNGIAQLKSEENTYTQQLPDRYINQYEESVEEDPATIYSAEFYETPFERRLVLINKNPIRRSIQNEVIIKLYPKNKEAYKNSKNYNAEGYLDFTYRAESIVQHFNGDNYGFREINLPFIDIEKLFIIQDGVWKNTFETPFDDIESDLKVNTDDCQGTIYEPLLINVLENFDVQYLTSEEQKRTSLEAFFKTHKKSFLEVEDSSEFWKSLARRNFAFKNYITIHNDQEDIMINSLNNVAKNKSVLPEIIDINKLAYYYATINMFSDNESKKITFVLNSETNLLEPFYIDTHELGTLNTYIKDERILNLDFLIKYAEKLNELSGLDIDIFMNRSPKFKETIRCRNQTNPEVIFDSKILKHNQLVLRKAVNPEVLVKAEFLSMTKNTLNVTVENLGLFPVSIVALNYKGKKPISSNKNTRLVIKGAKDTVNFNLPRSFENLFVHKKSKTTGFIFEKDIYDLSVGYQILGANTLKNTEIIPYQPFDNYDKTTDLFKQKPSLKNTEFLTVDSIAKKIYLSSSFTLNKPLIFPKEYMVIAEPGITINIEKEGKIISHSPLEFIGLNDKPIRIVSEDKLGQGLLVLAGGKPSRLKYVVFDGLTNLSHGMWSTTSAITFYESPVNLDNIKISNNTCEDALNIVRTNFTMTNSYFSNTQSDAFDGDFVEGDINSCVFENLGNDAIDVSGSKLNISNVKIINAGDKALSAGEDSQMTISEVDISNSGIGIAGKDLSIVNVKNLNIYNTKLGFTAFQKKPEFGPSNITATLIKMDSVETKYLIENTSSLLVDGEKIETSQADVKSRMYGVEFGVSSDETRNKKNN